MVAPLAEAAGGVTSQAEVSTPVATTAMATTAPVSWRFTAAMLAVAGRTEPPGPGPRPVRVRPVVRPAVRARDQSAGTSSPSRATRPGAYPVPAAGTGTGISSRCWSAW